MKHPFTREDLLATRLAYYHYVDDLDDMIQALWDSAVKRGAVSHAVHDYKHVAIIKLPEDKK